MPINLFTDNGPDYRCHVCGKDILGEIDHSCKEESFDELKIEDEREKQDEESSRNL